jgi:mono/diheme cytochrome c family protein
MRPLSLVVVALVLAGCLDPVVAQDPRPDAGPPGPVPSAFWLAGQRSSTVARLPISTHLLVASAELHELARVARPFAGLSSWLVTTLPLSGEPSAVSCARTIDRCWVALRGGSSIAEIDTSRDALRLVREVTVGSEPLGLAVSPNGKYVAVATFGESSLALLDTTSGLVSAVELNGSPRGVAFTDDGDDVDGDEHVWATRYFGVPENDSLVGHLVEVDPVSALVVRDVALRSAGFIADPSCAPNLLTSVVTGDASLLGGGLKRGHLAVAMAFHCVPLVQGVATAASFESAVAVFDPERGQWTDQGFVVPAPDVADVSFSRGGLLMLSRGRSLLVEHSSSPSSFSQVSTLAPCLASMGGPYGGGMGMGPGMSSQPILPQCTSVVPDTGMQGNTPGVPTGVVALDDGAAVVDRTNDSIWFHTDAETQRLGLRDAHGPPTFAEQVERQGRVHFFTALGRWSAPAAPVSCGGCHPDGLTDGLTWNFGSGPRQTISLDAAFAKNDPGDHRVQNWLAVADEISDVENLVRTEMGGLGALTTVDFTATEQPIPIDRAVPSLGLGTRNDALSGSSMGLVNRSAVDDWHTITSWVQHVPSTPAPTRLDPAAVAKGRVVFESAGCARCHGGPKWTISRVPYQPSVAVNGSQVGASGDPAMPSGLRLQARQRQGANNHDTLEVDVERVPQPDGTVKVRGGERLTCVLRDVGTFVEADPRERTKTGAVCAGALGYNPPSLLGLFTSAPYFHSGQALTLTDVFAPRFQAHTQAGNPLQPPLDSTQVEALVAFLSSIDQRTPTFAVPADAELCTPH